MLPDSYDALGRNRRRSFRRLTLTTIALLILVVLPLLFLAARRFERAMTFHPEAYRAGQTWTPPERGEDVWFETSDGVRLHGWLVRAERDEPDATVIYFHGNGGNLSYTGWLARHLSRRGFDVLLFDYRGYGRSAGAVSDEAALYRDADAAYDFLTRARGVPAEKLVLYGQSLGTTAAADVASRKPCAALILESGLSSASDMAALVIPALPRWAHRAARNRFESARKLRGVSRPVFVAHGGRDEVIPVEQGRALYAAANEPKRLVILPEAGHNDLVATGGEKYLDDLADFIRSSVNLNEK